MEMTAATNTTTTLPAFPLLSHAAHISHLALIAASALDRHLHAAAGAAVAPSEPSVDTVAPPSPPPPPPPHLRRLEELAGQLHLLRLLVDQVALCLPGGDPGHEDKDNDDGDRSRGEDNAAGWAGLDHSGDDPRTDDQDNGDAPVLAMLGAVLQVCDGAMEVLAMKVATLDGCHEEDRRLGEGTEEVTTPMARTTIASTAAPKTTTTTTTTGTKEMEGKREEVDMDDINEEAVAQYERMLTANRTVIYMGAQLLGENHWTALLQHPHAKKLVDQARRASSEVLKGRWGLVT